MTYRRDPDDRRSALRQLRWSSGREIRSGFFAYE